MVDFDYTDVQRMIRDTVRAFAEREIRPFLREWDEREVFPRNVFQKMAALGFLGVMVPEQYGGAGYGSSEFVIVIEELARVEPGIALSVAAHNSLCTAHIYRFGSEAQRERYVGPLARGEKLGAWALTEPEAGSDAGNLQTQAFWDGTAWVLRGTKNFTTHGTVGDVYVVMAVTDREKGRKGGLTAFIVERGTPGLIPGKRESKLGMRTSDTASVILDDCRVPPENVIGEVGQGFAQVLQVLEGGRVGIGALAVGIAQGAFEAALRYAQERRQFGRPIAEFQAIQFMLADMATQVEAARLLVHRAAWLRDQGRATPKESSMAKLFASEVAVRVADMAVQIFGGYGFVKDYPVEKYYRDAKLCTIGEGTSEIQRIVIARQALREIGFRLRAS
ncbi:MAG: acyl-CoA dehydrogenase family protein [Acidobacteria bacterium]|nr:acyl-CoA dehydrogenase family protein [Acidobacteriota bacterium]MDW7985420.1 acyl-CoA dehydrogenase family protein [Acidobacteriota bacterium]